MKRRITGYISAVKDNCVRDSSTGYEVSGLNYQTLLRRVKNRESHVSHESRGWIMYTPYMLFERYFKRKKIISVYKMREPGELFLVCEPKL